MKAKLYNCINCCSTKTRNANNKINHKMQILENMAVKSLLPWKHQSLCSRGSNVKMLPEDIQENSTSLLVIALIVLELHSFKVGKGLKSPHAGLNRVKVYGALRLPQPSLAISRPEKAPISTSASKWAYCKRNR